MTPGLQRFFQRWVINTLGVLVAANVVRGVQYDTYTGLLVASLLLGVLNSFLKPILMFFSLPFLLVTLGLFMLVINAAVLYLVGSLVKTFHVEGFWPAFWGALVISFVSQLANWLTGTGRNDGPGHGNGLPRRRRRRSRATVDSGSGPVIDV